MADDALVDALIRELRARQDIVRGALELQDEAEPLSYIGSLDISVRISAALMALTNMLRINRQELNSASSPEDMFKRLRDRASAAGVYVLLQGDLGSHHSAISADIFRGFALADRIAPFVVINDNDSTAAWSFTLLHELVHLLLGVTGISGGRSDTALEQFCNDVASEFLLDLSQLLSLRVNDDTNPQVATELIDQFALTRNLSRSMVAYRLFRAGVISYDYWLPLHNYFRAQWLNSRTISRQRARRSDGGPDYYVVRRHRIGEALVTLVRRMMASGAISTTKAAKVLSVKPQNVGILLARSTPEGRAA